MNTAAEVDALIQQLIDSGMDKAEVAWRTALACVGWAYVFGARGEYCTSANRRKYYASKGAEHPTIKTKCKGFDSGVCSGCKWYPGGNKTRFYDCRGFTYWTLLKVYNWKLMGAGATSQWGNEANWKAKGEIDTMPKDTLVCLFVKKGKTMSHTGFGLNNETVECSNGVQHFTSRNKKWTHWGIPACEGDVPVPTPTPTPTPTPDKKPTLKRGSKGEYVRMAQTLLFEKGYDLGKSGIDGDFGKATEAAVKAFQKDNGLTADGIIGEKTWNALESPTVLYTITIPHLSKTYADELVNKYPGAVMTEERG